MQLINQIEENEALETLSKNECILALNKQTISQKSDSSRDKKLTRSQSANVMLTGLTKFFKGNVLDSFKHKEEPNPFNFNKNKPLCK